MAEPKKRMSKSRTAMRRRQNQKVLLGGVSICPNCKNPMTPHNACPTCGQYRGRQVLDVTKKTNKK
ncbi:MAG: 50S ribosomal protein L32 [Patescibacteria group bacterium]